MLHAVTVQEGFRKVAQGKGFCRLGRREGNIQAEEWGDQRMADVSGDGNAPETLESHLGNTGKLTWREKSRLKKVCI